MNTLSDLEIIESVLSGKKHNYKLLVDRYKTKAFSLLIRMLKNKEEAEEVLQDSFIKAYYALANFNNNSKFSTWFYKIVYNSCLSHLSKLKRRSELEYVSIETEVEYGKNDETILSNLEDYKEELYKYIDLLPIKYSLILILFYIDELSINEISSTLNLSVSNTKVLLHRARTDLKNILEKHHFKQVIYG
ncbi:MAG TPA: sigma-70 family RNA polymerase sigma factor [Melioribacteraceae bacterium]|nr:sigma-70 family RNA polymerase sigma factor [Melioribacteraceae bacterium]